MASTRWYTFHELHLVVHHDPPELGAALVGVLEDLSWVRTIRGAPPPSLCLAVRPQDERLRVPGRAREVFRAEGFCGLACAEDFYLTDGASWFHLQATHGQGAAWLAPSFGAQPQRLQQTFWAFGLLKLLRPRGYYSLHAAGLVTPRGTGVLLVGASGSGKSTLTVGLLRQGWRSLSDDAVLLRHDPQGVTALALRQHVYVHDDGAPAYADLPGGATMPDERGRRKRRVHVEAAFPGQEVVGCRPGVLVFPRIVGQPTSCLQPLEPSRAIGRLLAQSGPQLFDKATMTPHLGVLTQLVQQASCYELQAGVDLYHHPRTLVRLLAEAQGAEP